MVNLNNTKFRQCVVDKQLQTVVDPGFGRGGRNFFPDFADGVKRSQASEVSYIL